MVRMTLVSLLLVSAYVAIGLALLLLAQQGRTWALIVLVLGAAIGYSVIVHYARATDVLLRSARVRIDSSDPIVAELEKRVVRLAALAELPAPRIGIAETDDLNAFTAGSEQGQAVVVISTGLYRRLEEHELDAVLAHEPAHIANRDAGVMTLASVPRSIGAAIVGQESGDAFYLWWFVWPLGLIPLGFGTLLTLTISRYREFAADRGSALITGRPEALMMRRPSSNRDVRIAYGDLRTVGALCIIGADFRRSELFRDHPALEKRLAKLAEIERELGHPERVHR